MASKPKGKAAIIALGPALPDDEEESSGKMKGMGDSEAVRRKAAEDLIEAMKDGDVNGVMDALDAHHMAYDD